MQHSIEKFLFFALLGIFTLSLPVYLNASETDESGLLISPASGEHKNEQTSSGPNNQHTASNVTLQSRWNIYELLFGINMASVAGDFYDFIKVDGKRLGILIADVSGHGVPASLISSMVKIAFSSQLPHAYDPAQVLSGINQILCGKLESDFVTAGYLFIDTENKTATYAGAGHPPLLLWRGSEQKIHEFRGKGIILGQFEDARYQNIELSLKSGDRLLLYTDGVTRRSICRCIDSAYLQLVRKTFRRSFR